MKALARGELRAAHRARASTSGCCCSCPCTRASAGASATSSAAARRCPADVLEAFHGMGFNFFEGYGLTETAPVLSVTSPKDKPIAGSVGQPLPGIEVKIAEPDPATGVGEVIARGRNVMAGYWEDPEATAAAIRDGWFHTGDLGRFDDDGNLLPRRALEGRHRRRQRQERLPRRARGPLPRLPLHQGAVGGRRPRRHRRAGGVRGGRRPRARSGAVGRGGAARGSRSTSARSRPICRSGSGCAGCTSGRGICRRPRSARSSAARWRRRSRALRRKNEETTGALAVAGASAGQVAWLLDTIATVSGRRRADVQLGSRFGELGFDSLMYAELVERARDRRASRCPRASTSPRSATVAELHELLARGPVAAARERAAQGARADDDGDIRVPSAVVGGGQAGARLGAAAVLRARARHARQGGEPRPAAHQLHRRREPLLAPRHGRDQGGARRRGART